MGAVLDGGILIGVTRVLQYLLLKVIARRSHLVLGERGVWRIRGVERESAILINSLKETTA